MPSRISHEQRVEPVSLCVVLSETRGARAGCGHPSVCTAAVNLPCIRSSCCAWGACGRNGRVPLLRPGLGDPAPARAHREQPQHQGLTRVVAGAPTRQSHFVTLMLNHCTRKSLRPGRAGAETPGRRHSGHPVRPSGHLSARRDLPVSTRTTTHRPA